jgi:ubiquinone biosynthesis protein UbiJ
MAGRQAANKAQRSPKGWQKLQRFTAEAIAAALLYLAACNQYTPVREDEAEAFADEIVELPDAVTQENARGIW